MRELVIITESVSIFCLFEFESESENETLLIILNLTDIRFDYVNVTACYSDIDRSTANQRGFQDYGYARQDETPMSQEVRAKAKAE